MLWRLTLAVVALACVGGICSCVRADVTSRLILPRDYGVKLCGREFIRAVIFTCGGSRWRRSTDGDSDAFRWTSLSGLTQADPQNTWQQSSELPDNRSLLRAPFSSSLADLVALRGVFEDQKQLPSDPLDKSPPSAVLREREANPSAADWPVTKKKRNFSLGVAGMCCSQGCTKNDIGRLC
ncbi:prorelaxin H1 [Aulostomus maculatus]